MTVIFVLALYVEWKVIETPCHLILLCRWVKRDTEIDGTASHISEVSEDSSIGHISGYVPAMIGALGYSAIPSPGGVSSLLEV
jgi:hypothetical protein